MKRFIAIFSILSVLFLNLNTIHAFAEQTRTLTQGIYNARDTNLLIGSPITAKMTSPNDKAIIIVIDASQTIHALVRLGPDIPQQVLPPLNYDYSLIIYGTGSVVLS
ncbi:hypothetical protein CDLVIII_3962 [Clostridium sp. DL-VIII]|uniref:hypothetical protein n=1 Tax=Clostridium sp. DL-VIII TaxID=641107 RepID=UPI00023B01A8|nr:hypothetical protein [Clostridium sp. DL-VIII]EHJ00501.1 hypothetical protein CDLVIII_3962 [Clostridium sp. DL-VIII]